ncbi:MAG: esterase [Motiliproteus sp.]|nr:esterase [Motiliproteus sp.]MCW9051546.1 esterase [Motiliproteus sp.]
MSKPLYIYVHGFNSSPQSFKARMLVEHFRQRGDESQILVPGLSHWPSKAMATLEALVADNSDRDIVLLGSSLGGYYAAYLTEKYGLKAVQINPSIRPYQLLEELLGENQNIYTEERYQLTRRHLDELLDLRCDTLKDLSRYLLLVQTDDEVLDYREAVDFYQGAEMSVEQGGSHGFDGFEAMIPKIEAFAAN